MVEKDEQKGLYFRWGRRREARRESRMGKGRPTGRAQELEKKPRMA